MVAAVEDLNLLALAIDSTSDSSVLGKNEERLSREEVRERLMWMGLIRLPELYDRAFATAWADELSEELETLSENVETPRTD